MSRIAAFVDEAVPRDGATYLLSCALVEAADIDEAKARMLAARRPGVRKLHWHDRRAQEHAAIVDVVAAVPASYLLITRDDDVSEPVERRRRKCLERLLWLLDQRGDVETATFEARQRRQNERDRKILDVMRASQAISARLRMEHLAGPVEPLLWLPDVVAGAYSAQLAGDSRMAKPLEALIEVITVSG